MAAKYGSQSIVASVDLAKINHKYQVKINNGSVLINSDAKLFIENIVNEQIVGEIYLTSMERDGTAQGYDLESLSLLPKNNTIPVILSGGVGNAQHFLDGISDERVSAISTAHLFNFVGDGLKKARHFLIQRGISLANWGD